MPLLALFVLHFLFIASLFVYYDGEHLALKHGYTALSIIGISIIVAILFTLPALFLVQHYHNALTEKIWIRMILVALFAELLVIGLFHIAF